MPKRPRSHVLEQEARQAIRAALPPEWVVRDLTPDYGLDLHIEIFTNEEPTPFQFYIQAKGTDSPMPSRRPSYRCSTRHLRYYLNVPAPVMLAVFFSASSSIRTAWIQEQYYSLSHEEKLRWHRQKSIAISLQGSLTRNDSRGIARTVVSHTLKMRRSRDLSPPCTVSLEISDLPTETEIVLLDLLRERLTARRETSFVSITSSPTREADVCISLSADPPQIALNASMSLPLLPQTLHSDGLSALLAIVAVVLAFGLSQIGRSDAALDVLGEVLHDSEPLPEEIKTLLTVSSPANLYVTCRREGEALVVAEELAERGDLNLALLIGSAAIRSPRARAYLGRFRRLLERLAEAHEQEPSGTVYSRANLLRSEGLYLEALHQYRRAATLDPAYRSRGYWWHEVAGCLFLLGKYQIAAKFYRNSLRLGGGNGPTQLLLADALLNCGHFADAYGEVGEYLEKTKLPFPDARLRLWFAGWLVSRFGAVVDQSDPSNRSPRKGDVDLTYRLGPLNPHAWRHEAVKRLERGEHPWRECLAVALLDESDLGAWVNATLMMLSDVEAAGLIAPLTVAATQRHGPRYDLALERQIGTEEDRSKILSLIYSVRSSSWARFDTRRNTFVARYVEPGMAEVTELENTE